MMNVIRQDSNLKEKLRGSELAFLKYTMTLHTEKGLSEQGLLWLSILTPISYFFFIGWFAWKDHLPQLDEAGLKTFMDISTLPLAILSLSLALAILVSSLHATKQTAEQIKTTKQKNNIDLYHFHRKELFAYFEQIGDFKYHENLTAKNKIHPRVHKSYFEGRPQDGMPIFNKNSFIQVEVRLESARRNLMDVMTDKNPDLTLSLYLANFCTNIYNAAQLLGLPEVILLMENSPKVPGKIKDKDVKLDTVGVTTDEAISAFKYAENFFHNLCDFANYESTYFKRVDTADEFNEVLRAVQKSPNESKVIEKLHANEIKNAIDELESNVS